MNVGNALHRLCKELGRRQETAMTYSVGKLGTTRKRRKRTGPQKAQKAGQPELAHFRLV